MNLNEYKKRLFSIENKDQFTQLALQAFEYQKVNCSPYKEYLSLIDKFDTHPKEIEEIPFLPIKSFKIRDVISKEPESQKSIEGYKIFTSSATKSMIPSKHYVRDIGLYERSFIKGFETVYGSLENYNLFALLPSYLEREGSSLVYMADKMIEIVKQSGGSGGFYLYNHENLLADLESALNKESSRKSILLGVSFALLDFAKYFADAAKEHSLNTDNLIVMETGGMKGRGVELERNRLHSILKEAFGVRYIHSEYGMAELLSQAYLNPQKNGEEIFAAPPWMRIVIRDLYNPYKLGGKDGGINIIDLANIHSCCFIESEDRGEIVCQEDNSATLLFKVKGRIEHSELRGCNLLLE